LLGSTADEWCVARPARAGRPGGVLRTTPPATSTLRLKRILVPTDFSDASKKAFPYASVLAHQFDAALVLVYVVPTSLPSDFSQIGLVIEEKRLIAEAGQKLPKLRESELDSDLPVESHVSNGDPAHEISRAAQEHDCDIIVIATQATGSKRFWLGSVAEKVIRHAQSPVLVMPRGGNTNSSGPIETRASKPAFRGFRQAQGELARSITDRFRPTFIASLGLSWHIPK
jgi:nucleotide-binding universal stress UspA family protein